MKFILTIEAKTKEEILEVLNGSHLQYDKIDTFDPDTTDKKFKLASRKNKAWTEFELNFLTENYLKKNARWVAGKLQRSMTGINQMLHTMYLKGLPQKRKKVKTL